MIIKESEFTTLAKTDKQLLKKGLESINLQIKLTENITNIFFANLKIENVIAMLDDPTTIIVKASTTFRLRFDFNVKGFIFNYNFNDVPTNKSIEALKLANEIILKLGAETTKSRNAIKQIRIAYFNLNKLKKQKETIETKLNGDEDEILNASNNIFHKAWNSTENKPNAMTSEFIITFLEENQNSISLAEISPLMKHCYPNLNIFETITKNLRI